MPGSLQVAERVFMPAGFSPMGELCAHTRKKKSNDKLPNNLKLPKGEVNPIMKASVLLRQPASKPGSQISPL